MPELKLTVPGIFTCTRHQLHIDTLSLLRLRCSTWPRCPARSSNELLHMHCVWAVIRACWCATSSGSPLCRVLWRGPDCHAASLHKASPIQSGATPSKPCKPWYPLQRCRQGAPAGAPHPPAARCARCPAAPPPRAAPPPARTPAPGRRPPAARAQPDPSCQRFTGTVQGCPMCCLCGGGVREMLGASSTPCRKPAFTRLTAPDYRPPAARAQPSPLNPKIFRACEFSRI